jgi:hypothetical protein
VFDEVRDASDIREVSGLRNSLAAQEFGVDFTEPYRVRGFDVRLQSRTARFNSSLTVARERTDSLTVEASPGRGSFRPVPGVLSQTGWRAEQTITISPRPWSGGSLTYGVGVQVRKLDDRPGLHHRYSARIGYERPFSTWTLVSSTFLGWSQSGLSQDQFRAGGPVSAPGYHVHEFESSSLLAQRLEVLVSVPFLSFPLGQWGRSPARATLAPYASLLVIETAEAIGSLAPRMEPYPSIGAGLLVFFDLVRFDVARGIRNGRWSFGVDLSRDLWRIL